MTREGRASVEVAIGRLPRTGSELFGREEELGWLDRCWEEGVHVACVVAWGGVGKSALVNGWLRGMMREGWRGAERVYAWSFYSQGTTDDKGASADEFVNAALRWFGDVDPTAGSPWDKGERLAGYVKKQRVLLILDGLEPMQWGPGVEEGKIKDPSLEALVRELGAQNLGMCLITSRIRVRDADDFGSEKNPQRNLDRLTAEAGAQLLRAREVKGEEELREAVEGYGGHGLSLTLLGSYLRRAYKGDVRKWREVGPLEEKHTRRIMIAYEGWFQGKPELAILRMLGLFDRPADAGEVGALRAEPAIVGLTDELGGIDKPRWNEALTALRDVGLLAGAGEEEERERLDTHPLVREHFGEMLRKVRPEAWREGHRRLYEHLKGVAEPLPETVEEMGPLYAAVVHGCRAGRHQEALDELYWTRIQRGEEAFNRTKLGAFGAQVAVLAAFFDPPWERLAAGIAEPDQAYVLNEAGIALRALGRLPEAAGLMRLGLEKRIAQADWKNAATQASNLSELWLTLGRLGEALTQAQQSVELADKSGNAFERLVGRTTLADVLHQRGRLPEAAAHFEEAERMQKADEPTYPRLYSLRAFRYCDLLLEQGQETEVLARAAQTLEWNTPLGRILDVALDHLSLGRAHLRLAQRDAKAHLPHATTHLQQAVEDLRRSGQQLYFPLGLLARAEFHLTTGDPARAHTDLAESLALSTRCGFRLHEADTHLLYARLHLQASSPALASPHLTKARALIEATGYHRRDTTLAELDAMHENQLLDALCALLPSELEVLLLKLDVSVAHLSGAQAPLATRATELLRYVKRQGTLAELERLLIATTAPPEPATVQTAAPRPLRPAPARTRGPARARFLHLSSETITVLHATAVQLGLVNARSTLLSGMDPGFTANLPTGTSPAALLSTDLDAMNAIERLTDGTVPLRSWIESALRLTSHRTEARVLRDTLALLPAHGPSDEG